MIRGRLLGLKLRDISARKCYCLSAVYFPTNEKLNVEIMHGITNKLRSFNIDEESTSMILGDFNFIDNSKDKKKALMQKIRF